MVTKAALLAAAALAAAGIAAAQEPRPAPPEAAPADSEAHRAEVVGRLASALEENFVFPDIARRYAEALRTKAAAGGYAGLGERFAETVTADLQAIHPDRHLRLGPTGARAAAGPGPRRVMRMPDASEAIGESGWIADGVAYINLTLFPGDPAVVERVRAFMEAHKSARFVIFDIRGHRGGGLAEMDVIFSYLFARETPLVGMDTRIAVERSGNNPMTDSATVRRVAGPEGVVRRMHHAVPGAAATPLRTAQVYLLTSRRSGSAAEHFALALKRTHRATLIGEPTAGAGHYGRMVDFGGYAAFIPVGRTFDPDTNVGWEGTGVAPDIAMPADQALDEALRRAGVAPAERRMLTPVGAEAPRS
jgi:hypothetical protein